MKKDVSNKALIWAALGSIAGLLIIFWVISLGPTEEEIANEKAIAERNAENEKLAADRMKAALDLRDEVLMRRWDQLFEEEVGSPSSITIDAERDIVATTGGVRMSGFAMIDGVKYEFTLGFDKKGDELVQDYFDVHKWEKHVPKSRPSVNVTVGGYLASPSEAILDAAISYAVQNDMAAYGKLIRSGQAIELKGGVPVEIMDVKLFSGKVKIRPRGSTTALWTVSEAVR
jgi:hypothetical protein